MTLPNLFREYAAYNVWANQRLLGWLQSKPEELLTKEIPSSFPSLRATLLHIWGAQHIWLKRLQGESPTQFIANEFTGSDEAVLEGLLDSTHALSAFVNARDDAFFASHTAYTHTNGNPYDQANAEILLHVHQHSTYHRGQIVTIARNLGLTDPPPTDYILYVRNRVMSDE